MYKPTVTVLFVLAACGDNEPSPHQPDATDVDAAPAGACVPRGTSGTITVEGPAGRATQTVTIVVHTPDGAVASRSSMVGANITATVDAPSCGMVSVHAADGVDDPRILTWTDVQPGDHLVHFGNRPEVERPLRFAVAAFPTATSYEVMATCSSRTFFPVTEEVEVGTVDLDVACPPGAQLVSVIAIATTPSGKAFAIAADATLATTGVTTVTLPAYQPASQTVTTTVRDVDASLVGGDAIVALLTRPSADRPLLLDYALAPVAATTSVTLPALGGGSTTVTLRSASTAPVDRIVEVQRSVGTFPATVELDFDTDFMPLLDASVDATPARPSVTWSAAGTFTADFAVLDVELPIDTARDLAWTLVAPGTTGVTRFPAMPSDLVPATAARLGSARLADLTAWTSYDEARNGFGAPPTTDYRGTTIVGDRATATRAATP